MVGDLLTNGLNQPPHPAYFRVKECEISNSTLLFSEVQSCWVLGFDAASPYSLKSISVNYVDDLTKLTSRTTGQKFTAEYYLTDLFQELRKTSKV